MRTLQRRLTEDQVREILLSDLSGQKIAERFGVSRQMVQRVRNGISYADVLPGLPRKVTGRSCAACIHCRQTMRTELRGKRGSYLRYSCDLELPEIKEIGIRFASECVYFQQ